MLDDSLTNQLNCCEVSKMNDDDDDKYDDDDDKYDNNNNNLLSICWHNSRKAFILLRWVRKF